VVEFKSKIAKFELVGKEEVVDREEIIKEDVKLPDDSPARMKTLRAEGKKWYLTVVYHETTEQPFAMFCHTNSHDKSTQTSDAVERLVKLARKKKIQKKHIDATLEKTNVDSNVSKLTRIISLLLRHGVLIKNIVAELDRMEDIFVGSFLFQVKKFLSQYIHNGEEVEGSVCSECGGTLVFSEGCMSCRDCGNSKCS
jgi:hypothetical protein